MFTHKELQTMIKSQMKLQGITLQQLGNKIGCTKQAISLVLNEASVTYDKLFKLADAVGLVVEIRTYVKGE